MRSWQLKTDDPITLTLAADARLAEINYTDDQIWELSLGGGEPSAVALQTTYGLRARAMRVFPRFVYEDNDIIDPAGYTSPPIVETFFPNYLRLNFAPFPSLDVQSEYWVPKSQLVVGRLRLQNCGAAALRFRFDWVAQLTPDEHGQRMAPAEIDACAVLCGKTGDLAPVIFMTAGPAAESSPFTALTYRLEIAPGDHLEFTWCHAGFSTEEESFSQARQAVALNWDAEIAHLELLNQGILNIHTGNPDWDATFALSQTVAYQLISGPTEHLPNRSLVTTRHTDQGYSLRGDGSDYNHLWSGQTPLDVYYLSQILLPGGADIIRELLLNFIATQAENGFIDWKPGLGGQRSRVMATPILATIAWQIFQQTEDTAFIERVFMPLKQFVHAWFSDAHDRDGDGLPEWNHPMQIGLDDHPLFSNWAQDSWGLDIRFYESPALCALLYQECSALLKMARRLNLSDSPPALQTLTDHLLASIDAGWDEGESTYNYWDRESHLAQSIDKLGERTGAGVLEVNRSFEQPVRPLIHIQLKETTNKSLKVFIHGQSASGKRRVESYTGEDFMWNQGKGFLTGERLYAHLDRLTIEDVKAEDRIAIYQAGVDYRDQSLLLPIWAGMLPEVRARSLITQTILNPDIYWRPHGLPIYPPSSSTSRPVNDQTVSLPWMAFTSAGLHQYGFLSEATELYTQMMEFIIKALREKHSFGQFYRADTGESFGERNALHGLAPLGLFLELLGVQIISPFKVRLSGLNPFPWPVTIKYRGLTILRGKENSTLIFPDGQTIEVTDPAPQVITLSAPMQVQ